MLLIFLCVCLCDFTFSYTRNTRNKQLRAAFQCGMYFGNFVIASAEIFARCRDISAVNRICGNNIPIEFTDKFCSVKSGKNHIRNESDLFVIIGKGITLGELVTHLLT